MTDALIDSAACAQPRTTSADDEVVLLDAAGNRIGTAPKREVHGPDTPLHLAVSCYIVRAGGDVLLTRRSSAKRTWPGVWTNACCGHPRPGEDIVAAARRHIRDELGVDAHRLALALPDFAYRATMDIGIVEHELCPVFVAEVIGDPLLDPDEADDFEWLPWTTLVERARTTPNRLSPWSVEQIRRLSMLTEHPLAWLDARHTTGSGHPGGPVRRDARVRSAGHNPFDLMGTEVDELVDRFMRDADATLGGLDPLAREVAQPIMELFRAGGKRIRPCLVYWGHRAATDDVGDADVTRAAAAVEMLHTFALLHDDVMDESSARRGRPTAHVHFSDLHARTRSSGDAMRFGASAAIVAGDLAFVWADDLLDQLECSPDRARDVRAVYSRLRHEVIAGQYLDLRLSTPCADDEQALTVALLKSARYTVTRPLQLGAALAGAPAETHAALQQYGDAIGVAFQLRDDVLGVFGDPATTGKGAIEDLRSAKASLLLVRALALAAPTHAAILRRHLGDPDLDELGADECRQVVAASGALASVEALIDAKVADADCALERVSDPAANALSTLARSLARRST